MIPSLKEQLHQSCVDIATQGTQEIFTALKSLQESLGEPSKSSAGDKHETSRAMAQLEQERLSKQLSEAQNVSFTLAKINPSVLCSKPVLGALIISSLGSYYLSVGLGKIMLNNQVYYAIALASPMAQAIALSKDNSFFFNGNAIRILSIE